MVTRLNQYGQPIGTAMDGWSARPRPPRTDMLGRYCRLEPIDPERHGTDLIAAYMEAPDDRDWTYLSFERPRNPEEFVSHLARLRKSEDPLHFAIVDTGTHRAVGTAAFMRIEPAHGVIEVGSITFSPRLKKTRAATEAMYLMMHRAFDELGYRRYEWKCDSLHATSRSAAKRYGFTFEGIFRDAIVYKSRSRDTAWHSITLQEWPRIRDAFQKWLDPTNFDAQGNQKQPLQARVVGNVEAGESAP